MKFNLLFRENGLDPAQVCMILHTTNLRPFRDLLTLIVADHLDLFDACQSVHSRPATAILAARPYAASFVPLAGRRMIYAGLFAVQSTGEQPVEVLYADPRFARLEQDFGDSDTGPVANLARGDIQVRFVMSPQHARSDLVGRLTISTPGGRTYVRIAANLDAVIAGIAEAGLLRHPPPDWRDMIVSAPEVRSLPDDWAVRLAKWCGIYLIVDQSDAMRYVGSAYGTDNLLARWQAHAAGEKGGTKYLSLHNPANLRFSILERTSPDLPAEEVIAIEQNRKRRLDTLHPHGLNSN